MDERLEAGRHHLSNGTRALESGFLDEGRAHYRAALLQFRGPELRLGEAHALRGLARVELSVGNTGAAATCIAAARRGYRETISQLEALGAAEDEGVAMLADARDGEAACLVITAEIASRQGDLRSAEIALRMAQKLVEERGLARSSVSMQQGRLALRQGRYAEAHTHFTAALDASNEERDDEGQIDALCAQAEVHRIKREISPAEQVLGRALALARGSRIGLLEGKVLAKLGDVRLQALDLPEAERLYAEAVPLLHDAGSSEAEAFALVGWGVARSLLGESEALEHLTEGSRLLALLDDRDGFAAAMYRLAEHAVRQREVSLALVAGEAARRAWGSIDPVEGVGRAMRMLVKALSVGGKTRSAYLVAKARAAVAGEVQPNAISVVAHFEPHLDAGWKTRVDELEAERLVDVASARIAELVDEALGGAHPPSMGAANELVAWADRVGELAVALGERHSELAAQLAAERAAEEAAIAEAEARRKAEAEAQEAEAQEADVPEEEAGTDDSAGAPESSEVTTATEDAVEEALEDESEVLESSEAEAESEEVSENAPVSSDDEAPLDTEASAAITAALEAEEAEETLRVKRREDSTPQPVEETDWKDLFDDLNTDEVPLDQIPAADLPDAEVITDPEDEDESVDEVSAEGLLVDEPVIDDEPPPRRTPGPAETRESGPDDKS